MEIQNFKMRVTPEQSRIVQQTLFNNGYKWQDGSTKVVLEQKTVLVLENCIKWTDEESFGGKDLPELTFQEFFDRYVKWCVKVTNKNYNTLEHWCINRIDFNLSYIPIQCYVVSDRVDRSYQRWTEHAPNGYIELTFEQFKKYVLKSKDMEKVIGYKFKKEYESYLKAYCAIVGISPEAAYIEDYKETGYVFQSKSIAYDRIKKAGVLDLWFEPVYESKELYFGKVKFTIHGGYADTEYGKVTKEEISKVFDYITDTPSLVEGKYQLIIPLDEDSKIKFGCQEGTIGELKAIERAM